MKIQDIIFESEIIPRVLGTTPIPDGYIRLYHQTSEGNISSILKHGLSIKHAKGIEGPW
jgi:hypothetical protein